MGNSLKKSNGPTIQHFGGAQSTASSPVRSEGSRGSARDVFGGNDDESEVESEMTVEVEVPVTNEKVHELKMFLKQHEMNPVICKCEISDLKKRFLRSNLATFRLKFVDKENKMIAEVTRHADEIELLHKKLGESLVGALIPPISKRMGSVVALDLTDEDAKSTEVQTAKHDKRNEKLAKSFEMFFNNALRHPFIKNDKLMLEFMATSETFTAQRASLLKDTPSKGREMWEVMIKLASTPKQPMGLIKMLHHELSVLHSLYATLKKDLKAHAAQLQSESNGLKTISAVFDHWMQVEGGGAPILIGSATMTKEQHDNPEKDVVEYENVSLSSTLKLLETTFASNSSSIDEKIIALKRVVKENLVFEISVLDHYKYLLNYAKETVVKYKRANRAFNSARNSYTSRVDKVHKMIEKQKQLEAQVGGQLGEPSSTNPTRPNAVPTAPSTPNSNRDSTGSNFATPVLEINDDRGVIKLKETLDSARILRENTVYQYHGVLRAVLVIELQRMKYERTWRSVTALKDLAQCNAISASSMFNNWQHASGTIPLSKLITPRCDLDVLGDDVQLILPSHHTEQVSPAVKQDRQHEEFKVAQAVETVSDIVKMRAIEDFTAENPGERNLEQGELVEGHVSHENAEWFYVVDQGYVPVSHLEIPAAESEEEPEPSAGTSANGEEAPVSNI